MANSFSQITKYLPQALDLVYKRGSLTQPIENKLMNIAGFENSNVIKIRNMSSNGLGTYSRSTGLPSGSVTVGWDTYTLQRDRGMKFAIDEMDLDESGSAIQEVTSEFVRSNVIPEIDAYRFATMYGSAGTKYLSSTPTSSTIFDSIDAAFETLAEAEADRNNLVLWVSPSVYTLLKQSADVTRMITVNSNSGNVDRRIESFDGVQIVEVPKNRFATGITLNSGSGSYGYTQTGRYINFILADKNSVAGYIKHTAGELITQPEDFFGVIYKYRVYHDCFVREQRKAGIYVDYSGSGV